MWRGRGRTATPTGASAPTTKRVRYWRAGPLPACAPPVSRPSPSSARRREADAVEILDAFAALALLCCLLVLGIVGRRSLLRRSGATLDLCLRYPGTTATGWALGVAKLGDDRLLWYRVFSFAPRPKVSLARGGFEIRERRRPAHAEGLSLMTGAVVVG